MTVCNWWYYHYDYCNISIYTHDKKNIEDNNNNSVIHIAILNWFPLIENNNLCIFEGQ